MSDFAVVYSAATGRIRRVVVPDDASGLEGVRHGEGEVPIRLSRDRYAEVPELQEFVSLLTGLVPAHDRYAVVSDGEVTGAILADPLCNDQLPGCVLIPHETASIGWVLKDGVLTPSVEA